MGVTLPATRRSSFEIEGQRVPIQIRRRSLDEARAYRAWLRALLDDPTIDDRDLTADEVACVKTYVTAWVSLVPGSLMVGDEDVTTGADLLRVIGENGAAVLRVLLALAHTSSASGDESLPSASGSVSVPSSDAHQPAPDGPSPETIAGSAEPAATAPTEAVTAEMASQSSGSMEIST